MAVSSAFSPEWPNGGWPRSCARASASTRSVFSPSCRGDGPRDLRHLDGMRQPVAEVVGVTAGENLCLRFQPAKGARMDNTVAVALKVVAVGMRRLGMAASARVFYADRIVGQHEKSLAAFRFRIMASLQRCRNAFGTRCPFEELHPHYCFAPSSLASFIFAESSFFCTRAWSAGSTSAARVRFHSLSARSQLVAASFRRPVF